MAVIRRARPDEASVLSDLALRSKGHWGYTSVFLEACRGSLTLSAEEVAADPVYVLEDEGNVAGFYGLAGKPPEGTLEYLFLEPGQIGQGYGRALWRHAFDTARELGFERLLIESDPNAEGFYLAVGAQRIGEVESSVQPGRLLPLLRLSLGSGSRIH
jgi:GNAT superfamily N-acetyltransferase